MKFLEEQDIACLKAGYSFDGEKRGFCLPGMRGRALTRKRFSALRAATSHRPQSLPPATARTVTAACWPPCWKAEQISCL